MSAGPIEKLAAEIARLPGIGRKTAQKLAFFILAMPKDEALSIANAIINVKENATLCRECFNISEGELCHICSEPRRDRTKICVVEEPSNIMVFERAGVYRGLYHVLHGALSPIDGVTPDMLRIGELAERIRRIGPGNIDEIILATNPNTRGEVTADYIRKELAPLGLNVSRIAYGLPMGGDIEFADEVTLSKSLEGRRKF